MRRYPSDSQNSRSKATLKFCSPRLPCLKQQLKTVYQHKAFLKYVDPGQYGLIRTRLNTKAKRIKRDGLSQIFSPIKPEIQGNQVIVCGKSRIFVGSQQTRAEDKAYKVTFIIRKGRVSDFIDMLADSNNG